MLKAVAQTPSATPSGSRRLAIVAILLAGSVPAFFGVAGNWEPGGVTWAPLGAFTTIAVFSAPALLATVALARRPVLFLTAAVTAYIALPLFVLALPMLVAAALWVVTFGRQVPSIRWDRRTVAAVVVSASLVLGAAGVLFFVRSPTVCTSEVTYADGAVRRATKVESQPSRRTESLPYRSGERAIASRSTCSDGALLPERSGLILGMLAVAFTAAFSVPRDG